MLTGLWTIGIKVPDIENSSFKSLCEPCASRYQPLVRGIRVHVIQRFVILSTIPQDTIAKPALPNDGLSPLFAQALQHAGCGDKKPRICLVPIFLGPSTA